VNVGQDPESIPDVPALIGQRQTGIALSGIHFNGPIRRGARRLCRRPYVLYPTKTELATSSSTSSSPDTKPAVLMVESEMRRRGTAEEVK